MNELRDAAEWITAADRVLITAGAGLSAAAGFDYTDHERFAELFPALHRAGLRARYEMIGRDLPAEYLWGFWAVHTKDIRFNPGPSPLYEQLRGIVGDRDYFVMTSNVDQLFSRNGFDADRMYTPQGDYGLYQCLTPCTREVWPSEPIIRQSLDNYDPATGKVSPEAIPSCPNCGGRVFLNVYAGAWYINDHFRPGLDRLNDWLAETRESGETLAVVEIGAGFNTPGVIRWPGEQVTRALPNARLIRVNRDHPDVPDDLADRAWAIAADARTVIEQLTHPSGASS